MFSRSLHRLKAFMLPIFAMLLILFFGSMPALASTSSTALSQASQLPSKLEQQVKAWVERLAEQKPFKDWQTADPQIEALGPGTHSWLVLFTKGGKDIGYMVVHAVTDGSFQLGEYGTGPYSLFSQQLMRQSLIDSGLITREDQAITARKHYAHPFAAAWEITIGQETFWLDAKTGEQLPLDAETWHRLFPDNKPDYSGAEDGQRTVALRLNESFDAYEKLTWLTKEAPFPAKDAAKLQKRLNNKQHLRYVTEPFGDAMLYAVPVVGYQRWSNGRLDMAIDMQGTRFIPLDAMLSNKGLFYR